MRIACISTSEVPGIAANALQTMKACQALILLGHEVQLWAPDYGETISDRDLRRLYGLREPVPLRRMSYLPGMKRYDFCGRAVLAARRWGAELVYTWPLQAAALAATLGHPTVLEMHGPPTGRMGPSLFRRFLAGRGAVRLMVTTRALRRQLEHSYDSQQVRDLTVLAPNAVDLELYEDLPGPSEARKQLGLPDRFTAGYTGHLYPGRGMELMLSLARETPDVSFVWAGGSVDAVDEWRRTAQQQGVSNLELMGFIPNRDLPLVQAAADLLLMPYQERIEVSGGGDSSGVASPMKAFEYLAAGRPILSSDLPVLREVLEETYAVLLPPDDLPAWREALEALRRDDSRRAALAGAARRQAERHTWRARAEQALEGLGR